MDIRQFAVAPDGHLHLRDAADQLMYADEAKKKPIAVRLHGPGSKEYARAQAAQHNRMLEALRRKGKSEKTAEQLRDEKAEFLADCTEAFEHVDYDGLQGRELALAVYGDATLGFIADQVGKFLGEWGNFTKGSASS